MPTKKSSKALSVVPLMELATSFWAFKTFASAVELDLFSYVSAQKGSTVAELAKAFSIHERPAEMLLTGCAALGLLGKKKDRYVNTPLSERFLVRGAPYYFGGMVTMLDKRLYAGWGKLTEAIRTNRPTTWDSDTLRSLFDDLDEAMLTHFWEAMYSVTISTAAALSQALDFKKFHRILDVGGGSAAFAIELCRRNKKLRATVYDMPQVVEIAATKIAAAGLTERIGTAGGDFFRDAEYPAGHDAIILSLIMHDWGEAENREILRKCHAALPSGGAVIISELLVNDDKTGPPPGALMSLNMLIETRDGRNYTAAEYGAWLCDIGFHKVRRVRVAGPGADGAVIGYKA